MSVDPFLLKVPDPPDPDKKNPAPRSSRGGGSKAKTAETVFSEAKILAKQYGVNRLLFLTLTFPDSVRDLTEAQRRWNSLQVRVFKPHYLRAIVCFERTPSSGLVHLHAVAVPAEDGDYRTGFNWAAYFEAKKHPELRAMFTRQYVRSASPCLRSQWKFWREVAPRYHFGRIEVLPVRTTAEQAARYIAAYLTKEEMRLAQDKKRRLLRFVGYSRKVNGKRQSQRNLTTNSWGWNSPGAQWARYRMRWAAQQIGVRNSTEAREQLGRHWSMKLREIGMKIPAAMVPERFREVYQLGLQRSAMKAVQVLNSIGRDTSDGLHRSGKWSNEADAY